MTVTSAAPIKRALVSALRANVALKAAVTPGGFHEGFALDKTKYPFVTYNLIYNPYEYDWGSVIEHAGFDVFVWSENPVDANNIDGLVITALQDAALSVDGQTTLYARRIADLSFADTDEEGKKIYQIGGTYEIWTDQPT